MIAFILLRGKDFSLPDSVSTAIIGLFFGLICGLFYYQHYYKQYYWAFSLAGGLILTYLSHHFFMRYFTIDDDSSLRLTIASFAAPFVLTLALNQALYYIKKQKRKKRTKRREHSRFFDTVDASEALQSPTHREITN